MGVEGLHRKNRIDQVAELAFGSFDLTLVRVLVWKEETDAGAAVGDHHAECAALFANC
jgi:hypothetical protein